MSEPTLYAAKVKCPNCNCHWAVYFQQFQVKPELVECETEEGGCGLIFAVTAKVTVTVTPTVRRIEGLEPEPPSSHTWEEPKMSTVTNAHGREIDFSAACILMDKEISDTLDDADIDSDQAFFDAYCDAHRVKFSEEFEPNKANPVW